MFKIDREANEIQPLQQRTFFDLGFKERAHLQEWIAKNPSCLGEELLIIQKEFAGFSDTNERLDLLALDKEGRLVIIENKLDDTGRDVVWQSLKYASYCSSLSNEGIRTIYQDFLTKSGSSEIAETKIADFLECDDFHEVVLNKGITQRIIMIAANFRKEVTSTIIWLTNFNLQIQCMKVTPYSMGSDLFLNLEQIIPTKDAEQYVIGLAVKAQDELSKTNEEKARHRLRKEFWAEVIAATQKKTSLYNNISPSNHNWIGAGSGLGGVGLNFAATQTYCRAEVYIDRRDKEENKAIFEMLYSMREDIEAKFGGELKWERLDTKQACRIKAETEGNIFDKDNWPDMIDFMVSSMVQLEATFRQPLQDISRKIKTLG